MALMGIVPCARRVSTRRRIPLTHAPPAGIILNLMATTEQRVVSGSNLLKDQIFNIKNEITPV